MCASNREETRSASQGHESARLSRICSRRLTRVRPVERSARLGLKTLASSKLKPAASRHPTTMPITASLDTAARHPAAARIPTAASADALLERFASALSLPDGRWTELQQATPFAGPSGLACRVHACAEPAGLRPEVLLPLTAAELDAPELRRLLTMQAFLLSEFGWYLGIGREGLLTLSAAQWSDDPEHAAWSLDIANMLASDALAVLAGIEPETPHAARRQ
jgi:hypothetical protein